jgi:hypothetical protein
VGREWGNKGKRENGHLLARFHSKSERSKLLSLKRKRQGEKKRRQNTILWFTAWSI